MNSDLEEAGIAYCIATYNHSEVLEDVLDKCILLYKKYNIDIYIYDSSTDNKTYEIVNHFLEQKTGNLYYIRIDPSIGIDDKLLMIFSGYGLQKKYKYLWPIKDKDFIYEHTLKIITESLAGNYDVIFLTLAKHPFFTVEGPSTPDFYNDPVEFYGDWGWLATSLDVTIFRVETLLKNIDPEKFKQRYFFYGENGFDHFTVLFHNLAQLETCSIKRIPFKDAGFYSSPLAISSWMNKLFYVWTDLWVKVTQALPSIYDKYKSKILKYTTAILLNSYDQMLSLKLSGILTSDIYVKIYQEWESFSDIPREDLGLIVLGDYAQLYEVILDRMNRLFQSKDYAALYELCKNNQQTISSLIGSREYVLLRNCLEIDTEERYYHVEKGIFYGISDYKEAAQKYVTLKYMLRRMEYGIAEDTWKELPAFIRENNISNTFIAYLVNKTCLEKEQTVDKLVALLNRFSM